MSYLAGLLAALTAALLWAIAPLIWYRVGNRIPPLELNFLKCNIAIIFLLITIFGQGLGPKLEPTPISLLIASGAIGIGLADTALFAALNNLGVRLTLLLKTVTSPLVALLALIFLKEQLGIFSAWGVLLVFGGVAWVVSDRAPDTNTAPKNLLSGIGWAMISATGDAAGVILSRAALSQTDINPLWSTLWRLSAGAIAMLLYLLFRNWAFPQQKTFSFRLLRKILSPKVGMAIALATFGSTYLGIWLQQIALKAAPAGIAQTLSATSPLFAIPIAIWMREAVSSRAILGAIVALVGVALIFK